jgi:hypothetical protein
MGRYETIGTTLGMKQVYTGDLIAEMREKYHDEDFVMTRREHRKYVNISCTLAEKVDDPAKFSKDEIRRAYIWFGICLDSERWKLNPEKAAEDLGIPSIRQIVHDYRMEERAQFHELLKKGNELISQEEWLQICEEYKFQGDRKNVVNDNWRRVITGGAIVLSKEVAKNGTEEEFKKAIIYLKICMDVNKYSLDYRRFRDENGIKELANKYGIDYIF